MVEEERIYVGKIIIAISWQKARVVTPTLKHTPKNNYDFLNQHKNCSRKSTFHSISQLAKGCLALLAFLNICDRVRICVLEQFLSQKFTL